MTLSKELCTCLKGVAISLIVIHNFFDYLLEIECNEMYYCQDYTDAFIANVFSSSFFWYVLSYAGWIGVPLFLFLSGYGLTKKYNSYQQINSYTYIKNHIVKLWKLLLPVSLLYFIIYVYVFNQPQVPHNLKSFLAQIPFLINLLDYGDNSFYIVPGVYWFFGAILQFYIIFLFIRRLSIKCLVVLSLSFLGINYFILYFVSNETMEWARHNCLGWGLPFVLGIIAAKSQKELPQKWHIFLSFLSLGGLCISLICKPFIPFVEIMTIILLISVSKYLNNRLFFLIGIISPSIFVIHPFIRMLLCNLFWASNYPIAMTIIYVILVGALSWLHHRVLNNPDLFKFKRTT